MDPACLVRRAQFLNAAFHRLGRRIGVSASCRLMEAASAGSFPPPSWRALSGASPNGRSIADYFDLIAGTSTGGILALGLGGGYSARELLELYTIRGYEIFPPFAASPVGRLKAWLREQEHYARYLL